MTDLRPWPEHQNPDTHRVASAPYNFVPLPEKIITAFSNASALPDHDHYDPKLASGYFDVTLTTRSPLYIRCPLPLEQVQQEEQDEQIKHTPDFFHTGNTNQPVIPASSLRGMLRAVLEIASYSKIQPVSEKQLFFRTMDNSAVGERYNQQMVKKLGQLRENGHPSAPGYATSVEGGFFHIRKNGTYFIEECTVARVEMQDLVTLFKLPNSNALYQLNGQAVNAKNAQNPNRTPNWIYQHRQIWATIDKTHNHFFPKKYNNNYQRHPDLYLRFQRARDLAETAGQEKRSGTLVLTGPMTFQHLAFLFVPLEQKPAPIEVPNDPEERDPNKRLVDHFHDNDQLTQWQTKAFPIDREPNVPPRPDGHLRDGDPVFFLREQGQLTCIGRAHMFRLPYKQRPIDLVPKELRQPEGIDYAEALFGFVHTSRQLKESGTDVPPQGDKPRAYASRVSVTDGVLLTKFKPENLWLSPQVMTPKILASPKPTAFQHYLTQKQPNNPKELNHYDSEHTVIRGHKLYWHQGLGFDQNMTLQEIRDAISDKGAKPDTNDTQHTRFKPLQPDVKFSFRVYFENLSEQELGALCWTLHPRGLQGHQYCHHLGMGKPLGMGAVDLRARLHIIDRPTRYGTLFHGNGWQDGELQQRQHQPEHSVSIGGITPASMGKDLADSAVLAQLTQAFEQHLLNKLNPNPPCKHLADLRRIAILLKLLEWPGYRAKEGERYLQAQERPNTRYMKIQPENEYRKRPVLPDPTMFDPLYFEEHKSRPQASQASQERGDQKAQLAVSMDRTSSRTTDRNYSDNSEEHFPLGRELRNQIRYKTNERGVEVKLLHFDPEQVIGFLPKERIDRQLGPNVSVIVTSLCRELNGRLVVELKLRPK